jgi:hypothetical protein
MEPTLLLKEERRRLQNVVPDSRMVGLDQVFDGSQSLDNVAVLYVAGHYDGRSLPFDAVSLSHVWLVVLNMCKTETVARQLLQQGVPNVVCWPTKVPDGLAADFGVNLIAGTLELEIDEAFHQAVEALPKSECRPILLRKAVECNHEQPDYVILQCPHTTTAKNFAPGDTASAKNFAVGKEAKVLWHTSHNGWVSVTVDGISLKWRVGNWTVLACSGANAPQKKEVGTVILGSLRGCQASRKLQYVGKKVDVLWDTKKSGWVQVDTGSEKVFWRIGHWTTVDVIQGDEEEDAAHNSSTSDSEIPPQVSEPQKSDCVESDTAQNRDVERVMLENRSNSAKGSGKSKFAGKQADVAWNTAAHGWVQVDVGSEKINWRIGHWKSLELSSGD